MVNVGTVNIAYMDPMGEERIVGLTDKLHPDLIPPVGLIEYMLYLFVCVGAIPQCSCIIYHY